MRRPLLLGVRLLNVGADRALNGGQLARDTRVRFGFGGAAGVEPLDSLAERINAQNQK